LCSALVGDQNGWATPGNDSRSKATVHFLVSRFELVLGDGRLALEQVLQEAQACLPPALATGRLLVCLLQRLGCGQVEAVLQRGRERQGRNAKGGAAVRSYVAVLRIGA
jgi:hypothetical protein